MAIEGAVIAGRIRMFKSDLERALGQMFGADAFTLMPGDEADMLVMRYVRENLTMEAAGPVGRAGGRNGAVLLEPKLVQSGEDMLDREPVWWVVVQFEAEGAIASLRVRNTLLFEVFDDQRNIMKFVRFPDRSQKTFYFDEDEAEHVVAFQPGTRTG
jgi:hypothetical protein